jgi:hypothetical protein
LEKNVEWFGLGLAGLWMLWVVIGYGIGTPVSVTLDNRTHGPGEIDPAIQNAAVRQLRDGLADRSSLELPKGDMVRGLTEVLRGRGMPTDLLANFWDENASRRPDGAVVSTTHDVQLVKASLPQVPSPTISGVRTFRCFVRRGTAAPAAPAAPGAPAAAPEASTVPEEDRDCATVFLKWDPAAFHKAVAAAKVPEHLRPAGVVILRTELWREELSQDSKKTWGNAQRVALLANNQCPPWPPADEEQKQTYVSWAAANQERLLRPEFYTVLAGDKWAPPGPAPAPAPTPPAGGAAPAVPPVPPAGAAPFNDAPGAELPGRVRGMLPRLPPAMPPGGAPPAPPAAAAALPAAVPGAFDMLWIHDDGLQEGSIYRYRARLIVSNPLYGAPAVCENPAVAAMLGIPADSNSAWSAWSEPVTVAGKTRFFVVGKPMADPITGRIVRNAVKVQVERWQKGGWAKTVIEAGPGDSLGDSPWLVGDIRVVREGDDTRVIFINENMEQETHTLSGDREKLQQAGG